MRIKTHTYGKRQGHTILGSSSSHLIRCGWKVKSPKNVEYPKPLRGFLLCVNSVDPQTKRPIVALDLMKRLGDYTGEGINKAIEGGIKADAALLPTSLMFFIPADAKRGQGGAWEYPGLLQSSYLYFAKAGRMCEGDGETASQRADLTTEGATGSRVITCNPRGKEGVDAKEICPFSQDRKCNAVIKLTLVLLYHPDGDPHMQPKLLADIEEARFTLTTQSETNALRIQAELDEAADKLDGRIGGLCGTLTIGIVPKRRPPEKGKSEGGMAHVPQLTLTLNQAMIRTREQTMKGLILDAPSERKALTAGPEIQKLSENPAEEIDLLDVEDLTQAETQKATTAEVRAAAEKVAEHFDGEIEGDRPPDAPAIGDEDAVSSDMTEPIEPDLTDRIPDENQQPSTPWPPGDIPDQSIPPRSKRLDRVADATPGDLIFSLERYIKWIVQHADGAWKFEDVAEIVLEFEHEGKRYNPKGAEAMRAKNQKFLHQITMGLFTDVDDHKAFLLCTEPSEVATDPTASGDLPF